jgi:hypothetical protein
VQLGQRIVCSIRLAAKAFEIEKAGEDHADSNHGGVPPALVEQPRLSLRSARAWNDLDYDASLHGRNQSNCGTSSGYIARADRSEPHV